MDTGETCASGVTRTYPEYPYVTPEVPYDSPTRSMGGGEEVYSGILDEVHYLRGLGTDSLSVPNVVTSSPLG